MNDLGENSKTRGRDLLPKLLVIMSVLVALGVVGLLNGVIPSQSGSGDEPLTTTPPPPTCKYCSRNLVSATSRQVGEFASELAASQLSPKGTTEVVLVRAITWEEAPELGLGCLPDFASIEDPPLALVILKGDLDLGSAVPGTAALPENKRRVQYVALVLDLWSAAWVYVNGSPTGEHFNKILNDPKLPAAKSTVSACPPRAPRSLHYGESAGGILVPTPNPGATEEPTAQPPVPVPTSQDRP